jgi:ABC-2 type transport system permease protein
MIRRSLMIAARINRQFLRDRRFLGLSLMVPFLLMLLMKYIFDSLPGLVRLGVHISDYAIMIAAYLVFFIAYVLSTIVLVRDRVIGTLSRMFVCGYRRREVVTGYIGGYSTIASVQTVEVLLLTHYFFNVDLIDDIATVLLTMLSLAVVSVGLGLFISNFARNEGQVFPFIPLVAVPAAFLSGIAIPIDDLPRALQWLSYLVPLRYAADVLREVLVKGGSFRDAAVSFIALIAFGLLLVSLASLTLKEGE